MARYKSVGDRTPRGCSRSSFAVLGGQRFSAQDLAPLIASSGAHLTVDVELGPAPRPSKRKGATTRHPNTFLSKAVSLYNRISRSPFLQELAKHHVPFPSSQCGRRKVANNLLLPCRQGKKNNSNKTQALANKSPSPKKGNMNGVRILLTPGPTGFEVRTE